MPRRNRNVRQRNLPRAAQRPPKHGTQRAQFDVRDDRRYTRQPSLLDQADTEYGLYAGYPAQ